MFTLAFWKAASERAIKTAGQTVLTVYFVAGEFLNVFQADWGSMVGVGLGGALLSYLTSIGSAAVNGDGPSLVPAAEVAAAEGEGRHEAPPVD